MLNKLFGNKRIVVVIVSIFVLAVMLVSCSSLTKKDPEQKGTNNKSVDFVIFSHLQAPYYNGAKVQIRDSRAISKEAVLEESTTGVDYPTDLSGGFVVEVTTVSGDNFYFRLDTPEVVLDWGGRHCIRIKFGLDEHCIPYAQLIDGPTKAVTYYPVKALDHEISGCSSRN